MTARVVSSVRLTAGFTWPARHPIVRLEVTDDAEESWHYIGLNKAELTKAEAVAAASQPMPAELIEAIEEADTPPAMREALRIAPRHKPGRSSREELRSVSGGRRLVRYRTPGGLHGPVQEADLVCLHAGIWCDRERRALFRRPTEDDADSVRSDGGDEKTDGKKKPPRPLHEIDPGGMPVLLATWRPAGSSDRRPDEETIYRLQWSSLPEIEPVDVTERQLKSGECWALFLGLAISTPGEIKLFANIVLSQVSAFEIERGESPRYTGHAERAGGWRFVFPDSRWIDAQGIQGGAYPIDGYTLSREHAEAWDAFRPPVAAPSGDDLAILAGFLTEADASGRLLLLCCAAARGLAATIVPLETAIMLLGQTGAGKTTAANFARGIVGPCPQSAAADSMFHNATNSGVETAIAPLRDVPVLVDDFHPSSEAEYKQIGAMIDALVTAGADGSEMRQRSTRERRRAKGTMLRCLAMLTGETLNLGMAAESRERRLIQLIYERGGMDISHLIEHWEPFQALLTAAGHAVLQSMLAALDSDRRHVHRAIKDADRFWSDWLYDKLYAARPAVPEEITRSIARNYARPCTGADMLDQACDAADRPMANALAHGCIALALAQLDRAAAGGAQCLTLEFCNAALRDAFDGRAHLFDDNTGKPLDSRTPNIADYGYRYTPARGDAQEAYFPNGGRMLGYLRLGPDGEPQKMRLDSGHLYDLFAAYAARHHKPWPWVEQTFPAALARCGAIVPATDGRHTKRRRVAGERPRLLEWRNTAVPAVPAVPNHENIIDISELPWDRCIFLGKKRSHENQSNINSIRQNGTAGTAGTAVCAHDRKNDRNIAPGTAYPGTAVPSEPSISTADINFEGEISPDFGHAKAERRVTRKTPVVKPVPTPPGPVPEPAEGPEAAPATQTLEDREGLASEPETAPETISEREPKYWPERIAVLDVNALLISERDGTITRLPLPESVRPGAPLGALCLLMIAHVITQLWIMPAWSKAAKLPVRLKGGASERDGMVHPWASPDSLPPGWGMKKAGQLKPWLRLYREGASGSIAITVPQLDERVCWKEAGSADDLLCAALLLKAAFDVSFKSGPGSFFQDLLSRSRRRGAFAAVIAPQDFPAPYRDSPSIAPAQAWERALLSDERLHKYVYRFDNNKNYIYAMNRLPLPIGKPELVTTPTFNPRRGGCWLAKTTGDPPHAELLPHPCHRTGWRTDPTTEAAWYTTTQLASARKLGLRVEIEEAWLYPEAKPMLEQVYVVIRDALIDLQQLADAGDGGAALAIDIIKDSYTRGLGWFDMDADREEDEPVDFHQPDWYAEIRAAGWAHILRQLHDTAAKSGRAPFAASKDAVYFTTDNPDPVAFAEEIGLPLGRRLGVFKPDGRALLADMLPMLDQPGNHLIALSRAMKSPAKPAEIKAALIRADDAAKAAAKARRR